MYDISKKIINVVAIVIVLSLVIYFNKKNKDHILYQLNNNNNTFTNIEPFENDIVLSEEEKPFIKPEDILEDKKQTTHNSLFDIQTIKDFANKKFSNDPKNLTQMNCKYFNLLDDKLNRDLVPKPGELFII